MLFTTQTRHHVVDSETVGTGVGIGLSLGAVAGLSYCLDECNDDAKKGVNIGIRAVVVGGLLLTLLVIDHLRH